LTDGSFHITCTTCTTRLLVRDESAVGQILACPKCGSMVMIESPEESQVPVAVMPVPGGVQPSAETSSIPSDPVPPTEQSTAWQPSTGHGWLPIAFGSVGAMAFASALGWYVLSGNDNTPVAVVPLPTVEVDASETRLETETQETAAEDSEPPFNEDPTIVDLPKDETTPDVEITADDVDPFREADRIQSQEPEIAPASDEPESVTALKPTMTDELSSLASLLSGPSELVTPPVSDEVEQSDTKPRLLKTSVPTATTTRDLKQQLDQQTRAVRFQDVPLVDFLRSMTTLSGVPISLDPAALEQTANTANVPVSVAKVNGTTIEILREALGPVGMMPVLDKQVVRITTQRLEDSELTTASLFVGDLLDAGETQLDLANFVATLCEPTTWISAGGLGTIAVEGDRLHVSNTRLATIRTMILLEKIRTARSLPPRNKIPSRLTSLEPRWHALSRQLRKPIDIDLWQESTFVEIVTAMELASDLRILIDWPALVGQGFEPSTVASLYVRDTSLEEALQELLRDRNLHVVPIDSETVQITTSAIKTNRKYVEFYSFKQLGNFGLENVEQLMLQGTAALDPASEVAIVVGNADLHRSLSQ